MSNHLAGRLAFKSKSGLTYTHSACGLVGPSSAAWQVPAKLAQKHPGLVRCKLCRKSALFTSLIGGAQ